jgi:hypothetical protein
MTNATAGEQLVNFASNAGHGASRSHLRHDFECEGGVTVAKKSKKKDKDKGKKKKK